MNISEVKSKFLKIPLGSARGGSGATELEVVFVEIKLANGAIGTGFTYTLTGGGQSIKSLLDNTFVPELIGSTVYDWDMKWESFWNLTNRLGRGISLLALSALDIAIWDLRGKLQNLPLYKVLGVHRHKVPVYGSGRATHQMSTEELIEGALSYQKEGYKSIKLRAGAHSLDKDIERITAVRDTIGPNMQMMIDVNQRLTYPEALQLGKHLEELDIFWMEEPLIADDIQGHRQLAKHLKVAIATGEHLHGRFDFVQYIQNEAASIFQPDAPIVGGITECLRIGTIAEGFGQLISPHFLPELHIHLGASMKNCISIEHFPLIDEILEESLTAKDGFMTPPNRPGHGMKWDYDAIIQFEQSY